VTVVLWGMQLCGALIPHTIRSVTSTLTRAWSHTSTGIAYETAVRASCTRKLWDTPRATKPAEYAVKLSNDIPEGSQKPRAKQTATRDSATHCTAPRSCSGEESTVVRWQLMQGAHQTYWTIDMVFLPIIVHLTHGQCPKLCCYSPTLTSPGVRSGEQ
jgi:hypothetical protein